MPRKNTTQNQTVNPVECELPASLTSLTPLALHHTMTAGGTHLHYQPVLLTSHGLPTWPRQQPHRPLASLWQPRGNKYYTKTLLLTAGLLSLASHALPTHQYHAPRVTGSWGTRLPSHGVKLQVIPRLAAVFQRQFVSDIQYGVFSGDIIH